MTSRLDRLFLLLETGSSNVTRKAAAQQLGEVQRLHPHELNYLLTKVRQYLHSTSWETRIAASQAVEAIASNVPFWLPNGIKSEDNQDSQPASTVGRMNFAQFDINVVMKCGHNLLASEGTEFDESQDSGERCSNESNDSKEKLAKQRQLLNQRLGLEMAEKLGLQIDSNDIISNDDLTDQTESKNVISNDKGPELDEILRKATGRPFKRKASHLTKLKSVERKLSSDKELKLSDTKKIKTSDDNSNISEDLTVETEEWPLESFSDELMSDLFSPNWEVRHGASTALREIVKLHGRCGGRTRNAPSDQMDYLNQMWLEDLALRFLCVLALDKFGDFVSDQVVAPVRETCAQTLGLILNLLNSDGVNSVLKILLQLLARPEWEARHGGLLGIKYLLAIRQDLTAKLIPIVFQPIFDGLKDSVDDVSAVAAAALVPVKDVLIKELPDKVPVVIDYLWDSLLDLDDLSSSTCDLLMLLSSLLTFNSSINYDPAVLTKLVPRLWPFLNHSLSSVRKSVLESLVILTHPSRNPCSWLTTSLLSDALRLLYQRCLLENKLDILNLIYDVWYQLVTGSNVENLLISSCQHLSGWICLMMHPSRIPIDPNNCAAWLEIKNIYQNQNHDNKQGRNNKYEMHNNCDREEYFLGGNDLIGDSQEQKEKLVIRARLQAAKLIGLFACFLSKPVTNESPSPLECFANILLFHLNSKSAIQRMCIAWIINQWGKSLLKFETTSDFKLMPSISCKILQCLQEPIYFDEISSSFSRLQIETREFVALLKQHNFPLENNLYEQNVFTFDSISTLINCLNNNSFKFKPKALEIIEAKRKSLVKSLNDSKSIQTSLNITTLSSLAGALISWGELPDKLNPLIRPLMDSIKSETNEQLQTESSLNLVNFMKICCNRENINPSPVPKIIKNLIIYLCSDANYTPALNSSPNFTNAGASSSSSDSSSSPSTSPIYKQVIFTLEKMLKAADRNILMKRSNSLVSNKKAKCEGNLVDDSELEDQQNEILRRGASQALALTTQKFAIELIDKLPTLWEQFNNIENKKENNLDITSNQNLINSLQVLEIVGPHLHSDLHIHLKQLLPHISSCLQNEFSQVRHMAARCFGMLSKVIKSQTMDVVLTQLLEFIETSDSVIKRQGAVEAISCVIDKLQLDIVPYIVLLIVPMLGRMSDQNDQVRLLATHCFAQLVQLMPLDHDKNASEIDEKFAIKKENERHFLEQLMNCKNIDNYEMPIPIKAELRSYQQDGINWLAFLNKYKLHGIVADEMGLGKTLQAICILASDHFYRAKKYKETKSDDCKPLPSIAICPPTLTGHWVYEVQKFVDQKHLNPLHYTGPPTERAKLKNKIKRNSNEKNSYNLVIASYDIVRNDIEFFSSINWNYCILDEGHVIKNGKTKLSKAIKSLQANHRLILTGTPIQNNVLELWSLFDFLMPGFLGTERQFMARYSRPILQSREAKSSSKEQEAGVLAMESLHRQVLPFVLRRMKEDVLKDLPPKIMQDYYCELSPLQSELYEDFSRSKTKQNLQTTIKNSGDKSDENISSSHIFQALQYLRKVCNHPKLVLTSQHPKYESITQQLQQQNSSLSDINHASKLCALRQLLLDCGIGTQTSTSLLNGSEPVVNQHRALIFCQLKSMLDIVENDLLKTHMPSVTYLRLDGSIPPGSRHSVVYRFNNDPSIDVLLLTTQVIL